MNLVPLSDKIIVKMDTADETSPGGIFLPDVSKKRPKRGKVLSVGPGKRRDDGSLAPMSVHEGQRILFQEYVGHNTPLGDDVIIISDSDVLAVLE